VKERVRGIRGATTVKCDEEALILKATEELLLELIAKNHINPEDVASVWVTTTPDLVSTFPAKAMRDLEGWSLVPVMCSTEIPVPNSLSRCIRLMLHINTTLSQEDIQHVYLHDAIQLRPDLHTIATKKS